MNYSVKYKKSGSFFWSKIKNIKGDLTDKESQQRIFLLADETRIEIPIFGNIFCFSKERYTSILQNMEKISGQKMAVE